MSWLFVLIAAAAINILTAELFDWLPWIAERIVKRSSHRLPPNVSERYLDEWLGELDALPGKHISPVIFAIRVRAGARSVGREVSPATAIPVRRLRIKYGFDRALALALLIVLAPLILCAAIAVRLSSPGPAFSRERRVGYDGKAFDSYTFRSARVVSGAESRAGDGTTLAFLLGCDIALIGVESAERSTPVGRFLQYTALDELPQLFNVLLGDISMVGPRAGLPQFAALFSEALMSRNRRHVKSGITGWAQVHGLRERTSFAERVEWDNYYVAHRSLRLDLKVLFLTVAALFD